MNSSPDPSTSSRSLTTASLAAWDSYLEADDKAYAAAYPGPPAPGAVHTVYLPVPRFTGGDTGRWGIEAAAATVEHGPQWISVLQELAVPDASAALLEELVQRKLEAEPIEDLRIDFEDGFRSHRGTPADDADEDAQAIRAARIVADAPRMPRSWGMRVRSLAPATRARGLRTLDLFLTTLMQRSGAVPEGFVVTLPKVTSAEQVHVFCQVLLELEDVLDLPTRSIHFEIQVETPQTVLGADGVVPVARMIHAGHGRVSGLHFGTYDYTASLGILGAHQNLRHPVADFAKGIMQLAAAETGVRVSDGSDNKVPVGDSATVLSRWRAHAQGVQRALRSGIFQGWDLHPAQLPTRFAATFAFFRDGWADAATRLAAYHLGRPGPAGVLDEPATAFALARHLAAALACGALAPVELAEVATIDSDVVARYLVRNTPPLGSDRGAVASEEGER